MQHLTLEVPQVESEREVVANERRFRVDDDVEGFLAEELFKLAFERHPYHHPTIGWMKDILGLTLEDCRDFYRTFYAPNNATLVLAGAFERAQALTLIEEHYGRIRASSIPDVAVPEEPPQAGERRARYGKPVAADRMLVGYRAPAQGHADWLPLLFANELLLGGPSSRLWRRLIVVEECAAQAQGMVMPFQHPGLYEIVVSMKRGHRATEAEAALDEEIARLASDPIPDAELEKVRNRVETDFWCELETADGKAEALGHYETVVGDYRRLFDFATRAESITAEDVKRAVRTYLGREGRTLVVAEPSGEAPPGGDDGDEDEEVAS
jgi:zinc protease